MSAVPPVSVLVTFFVVFLVLVTGATLSVSVLVTFFVVFLVLVTGATLSFSDLITFFVVFLVEPHILLQSSLVISSGAIPPVIL